MGSKLFNIYVHTYMFVYRVYMCIHILHFPSNCEAWGPDSSHKDGFCARNVEF